MTLAPSLRTFGLATAASLAAACGTAATAALPTGDAAVLDAHVAEAGCQPNGSVPGCPCDLPVPGTAPHVGDIACASGAGPAVVACGQKGADGGPVFAASDASVWIPFFTCPGKDKCSAVTTYDEFTCTDPASGVISYLAILGAPCFHETEGACSIDKSTVMECEKGTWTSFQSCTGHSCVQQGQHPACGKM
jgi:hypothetical protein